MMVRPASLVLFERYENSPHSLRLELQDAAGGGSVSVTAAIGDVTDAALVASAFAEFRQELVFHAAAHEHKHVQLIEENPCEAVKNCVRGTRGRAAAATAAFLTAVTILASVTVAELEMKR